jgi:hypothetical protein
VSGNKRTDLSARAYAAREAVWKALAAVGGSDSIGGSVLWACIGFEQSLKQWTLQQRLAGTKITQEGASWVLISALAVLAQHYGLLRS